MPVQLGKADVKSLLIAASRPSPIKTAVARTNPPSARLAQLEAERKPKRPRTWAIHSKGSPAPMA